MATEQQSNPDCDQLIVGLKAGIRDAVIGYISRSSTALSPSQVAEAAFGEVRENLDVIHPHRGLEVARQHFHRYWVAVVADMSAAGELQITSSLNFAQPRQLAAA